MPPVDKSKDTTKVRKKPGRRQTSCAECRRLKLKCDRNVPCEKCVSRGCAQICPEGVLASTKGNRMILSGTEELHERIDSLCTRIKELEDALKSLQEQVSDQPHPLLRTDILREVEPQLRALSRPASQSHDSAFNSGASTSESSTKSLGASSDESVRLPLVNSKPTRPTDDPDARHPVIDAFGTISVLKDGALKYVGKTARPEFLICADFSPTEGNSGMPFPDFDPKGYPSISKNELYRSLPLFSEASQLCEAYLRHKGSIYAAIPHAELYDDILRTVYGGRPDSYQAHHTMALLLMVFAVSLHFEGQREKDAYRYYQLARATLSLASPFVVTTVSSIQALIHMAQYLDLSEWEPSGSTAVWLYIGHATRLGLSIGLHLNPERWRLPGADVTRRKRVFWQLFLADTWTSLHFGRPPTVSLSYVDCPIPDDASSAASLSIPMQIDQTRHQGTCESWAYRFTSLLSSVLASGMGAKQPSYDTILDLDCQVREFPVHADWRATVERAVAPVAPEVHYQRWYVIACKETTLLNLHRGYFAQALSENFGDDGEGLQDHRYMPSVLSVYRSAWRIVAGLQLAWSHIPNLLQRINLPWSQGLSAAIVLCLLVTQASSSHLVAPALEKLRQLLTLFRSAAHLCRPAATLVPSIQRLYNKAYEADNPPQYRPSASASESSITQAELERLNGKTHLFSPAEIHPSQASYPMNSAPFPHTIPQTRPLARSATVTGLPFNLESLHAVLVKDIRDYSVRETTPSEPSLTDRDVTIESPLTPTGGQVPGRSSDPQPSSHNMRVAPPPSSSRWVPSPSPPPTLPHERRPIYYSHNDGDSRTPYGRDRRNLDGPPPLPNTQAHQQHPYQHPYGADSGHAMPSTSTGLYANIQHPQPAYVRHHPPPAYLSPSPDASVASGTQFNSHQPLAHSVDHHHLRTHSHPYVIRGEHHPHMHLDSDSPLHPPHTHTHSSPAHSNSSTMHSMDTSADNSSSPNHVGDDNGNDGGNGGSGEFAFDSTQSATRKMSLYASLTPPCIPGFSPAIEMLDQSWQTLVEQLGY